MPGLFRFFLDLLHSRLASNTPPGPQPLPPLGVTHLCDSPGDMAINDCSCIYKHLQMKSCCPSIYELDIDNQKTTDQETFLPDDKSVECCDKEALLLLTLGNDETKYTERSDKCSLRTAKHDVIN